VLLYVAQNLSFKDWLIYSQIAGMPVCGSGFQPVSVAPVSNR
jgi:hypothetical protein